MVEMAFAPNLQSSIPRPTAIKLTAGSAQATNQTKNHFGFPQPTTTRYPPQETRADTTMTAFHA